MKINFTKKEYQLLVDLLNTADWVLHAHTAGERQDTRDYAQLIQRILSYAKQMGMESSIKYDKGLERYVPTSNYEESGKHMQFIDLYDDDVFWDGLSYKLSLRDLIEQEGQTAVEKMDFTERGSKLIQLQEWYEEEFDQNGIKNVKVVTEKIKKSN